MRTDFQDSVYKNICGSVLLQLLQLLFSAFQQCPFQGPFSPKLQAIVDTLYLGKV